MVFLDAALRRRRKNSRPTMPAMARTPITTGAAMAATGTGLLEELAWGDGELMGVAITVKGDVGASVMTRAVLFAWST